MPDLDPAFDRIAAFLEPRLPMMRAPGAALAVTDAERTLGVVTRGHADVASHTPVRPETLFQIGSISKSFAAVVAMQEVAAGRLDLHASVNDILPWLELPEPFGPITPHHLKTHSAGLAIGSEEAPSAVGAACVLRQQRVGFAPGERFWYSNDGWKVLGLILERTAGVPIHELIAHRVLEPLGMMSSTAAITSELRPHVATGYRSLFDDRPARVGHPLVPAGWYVFNTADGSIVSNVLDLAAYARMLLGRGRPLLDEAAFDLLTSPAIVDEDWPTFRYAYGLWVGEEDGRRRIWHSGAMVGYTSLLIVEPDEGLACAMLVNGEGHRRPSVRYALDCVRAALAGSDPPDPGPPPSAHRVADPSAYAGTYRGGRRTASIEPDGDGLALVDGERRARLEVVEDMPDVFLVDDTDLDRWPLRFGRSAGGDVVEVFHGDDWMVIGGRVERPEPHPPAWEAFPGLYRRANAWSPTVRVALRKGRVVVEWNDDFEESSEELEPLDDDPQGREFHVGAEAWKPQWVRFDDVVDGRATRLTINGGTWYRSFED